MSAISKLSAAEVIRLLDLAPHPEEPHLRVVDKFLAREHRSAWNVAFAQDLEPFLARPRAHRGFENLLERLPIVLTSPRRALEARIAHEVHAIDR